MVCNCARNNIPMFLSIGEQLWLPGVGHAEDVRLGEGSRTGGCEQRRALPGIQQNYGC